MLKFESNNFTVIHLFPTVYLHYTTDYIFLPALIFIPTEIVHNHKII